MRMQAKMCHMMQLTRLNQYCSTCDFLADPNSWRKRLLAGTHMGRPVGDPNSAYSSPWMLYDMLERISPLPL